MNSLLTTKAFIDLSNNTPRKFAKFHDLNLSKRLQIAPTLKPAASKA